MNQWGQTWPDGEPIYEHDGALWLGSVGRGNQFTPEYHIYQRSGSDVIHSPDGYDYYTAGDWVDRHGANVVWARHESYRGWRRLDPDTAHRFSGGIKVQYQRLVPIVNNVIFLSEDTLVSINPR